MLDIDRNFYYGPCYMGGRLGGLFSKRDVHDVDGTYLPWASVSVLVSANLLVYTCIYMYVNTSSIGLMQFVT